MYRGGNEGAPSSLLQQAWSIFRNLKQTELAPASMYSRRSRVGEVGSVKEGRKEGEGGK
jgi:hypothetical protein